MDSMPETPGRGRSRFSKALPVPPPNDSTTVHLTSPAIVTPSKPLNSPLPATPTSKLSLPPIVQAIPRRPLGMTAEQKALYAALAKASNSPLYASSPVPSLTRSTSENSNSTMDSTNNGESVEAANTPVTPPVPPKDEQRQQRTKTPEPLPNSNGSFPLQKPSPPRPEIWRRRSLVKNDINVTELRLDRSNGSTASPPRHPPPQGGLPQLPRSNTGTNPTSFNRKPVPIRKPSPPLEQMGSTASKIRETATQPANHRAHSSTVSKEESPFYNSKRPPTPEYAAGDDQDENLDHVAADNLTKVISPHSPVTPPEDTRPRIPPRSDSRKALPIHSQLHADPIPSIGPIDYGSGITLPHSESKGISQQPLPTLPNQSHEEERLLEPQARDDADLKKSPLDLPSPAEDKELPPPNIYFPRISTTPLPEDTILTGMPLTITHFQCYQSHRFMRGNRNLICPVACMVCGKQDREMRWRCNWCCLSACAGCMQVLTQTPGKDLKVAMETIEMVDVQT